MKRLILIVFATGFATLALGQKAFIFSRQPKKGFFTIAAGSSLPVGHFASCSVANEKACMARNGVSTNISAGYQVTGRVGLMARYEQQRNSFRAEALLNGLIRNEGDQWTANAGDWSVSTLMGGPYINFPWGRASLDARLLAGHATAICPNTSLEGTAGGTSMSVQTTGSRSQAMSYGGGVTLRYRIGRSFSLNLNSDYTRAQFRFDNLTSIAQTGSGRSESGLYSSDRIISAVSLTAGISVLFGNEHRPF